MIESILINGVNKNLKIQQFAEIFGSQGATGINDTGGNSSQVSTKPVANLPLVSTTPVANNGNTIRLLTPWSELEEKNISMLIRLHKGVF